MSVQEKEILVVVSKLKAYVKNKSGMSVSASVTEVLSDKIRTLLDEAIENASRDKRKTVMDRDIQ
jgi:histone H3/H4